MASGKLFIGRKVREIRLEKNVTQAQFAERLGISTSYLNQIESNQRPVSAAVLVALVDKFRLEFSDLASGESDRLLSALSEALSDPLFEAYSPSTQELKLITQNAPGFAHALIRCHQAYRSNNERLAGLDQELGRGLTEITPYEEVRDFFHFVDNYIHDLDVAAEKLSDVMGNGAALANHQHIYVRYLEEHHAIKTVYTTQSALRRFHKDARVVTLNSFTAPQTQVFQLAVQIAQLEASPLVDAIIKNANFRSDEAAEICRIGLHNYFAGALVMPYGAFAQAAKELRHDIELLALRFGTSLEQVCHRLSTLQRPGLKGVPIFFARIDRAGNITKRHSATRLQFARFGSACPLWNAHQAFDAQGRVIRQLAETPDGVRYLSLALQVNKGSAGFHSGQTSCVLAFGCEISYAEAFVYSDGLNMNERTSYEAIGISCRICDREDCTSRAVPPLKRKLNVDHNNRQQIPYDLR
jgi:XRE family transcriptional regulator, fatty acid utilization regulator